MVVPHTAIDEALRLLLPAMDSAKARVLLLAIGLQESRFVYRRQIRGPARGFWQFELGGGVVGVLTHPASREPAASLCYARDVPALSRAVYDRIAHDDVLAAGFARLLLWTDPLPLPEIGEEALAWEYYLRNWRPGKPHPKAWGECYCKAIVEHQGRK